jgi:hypothetical protein
VILSFHNSILLRNARGGKLLINPTLKAKLIKRGISELSRIVIANSFQAVVMLIFNLKAKLRKSSNTLSLLSKKKT